MSSSKESILAMDSIDCVGWATVDQKSKIRETLAPPEIVCER